MDLKAMREAAINRLREIKAAAAGRDFTAEEADEIQAKSAEIADIDLKLKSATELERLLGTHAPEKAEEKPAKSLGEHFLATSGVKDATRRPGLSLVAPEMKAATDVHVRPTTAPLTETATVTDLAIVEAPRRPLVTDLFGTGVISVGNTVRYFVEGEFEGGFKSTAENTAKPQFHVGEPTPQLDSLVKIAGWYNESDEMLEDYEWLVSSINNRAIYELLLEEERQLLNGTGGADILGVLNRSGVQTGTATAATLADELFKSMTDVQTASGLTADAIVMNPVDYQTLRLSKDGNGQYYAGGMFAGQYGQGGIVEQPPVWGLRTVVTPAIAAGTAVVGAFRQAATVYRKGGITVEATNTHGDDFTHNRITVRIEERLALAVRRPAAFKKLTISAG